MKTTTAVPATTFLGITDSMFRPITHGLFMAACFWLGSTHALSATYYIDWATGVDTRDGLTTTTPWKHCPGDTQATGIPAATILSAGDTVKFKGGVVYYGGFVISRSGTASAPLTYDGNINGDWGTGRAVIDRQFAAFSTCIIVNSGVSHVRILNFELRHAGGYADDSPEVINAANGTVTNTVNTGGVGISMDNGATRNITLANLLVHRIGGWRGTLGWAGSTIRGAGIKTINATDFVVTNCEFTHTSLGITLYSSTIASNIDIVACDFHDNMVWCIDMTPHSNTGRFSDVRIHETRIHDFDQYDFGKWGGPDADPPHTDGVFARNAGATGSSWTNVNIYNCLFYNTNKVVTSGGTASIFISEGPSVNVYNNVFNGDMQTREVGVGWRNTSSVRQIVRIYNNTFLSLTSPALIMDMETDTNRRDIFVENNIFMEVPGIRANAPRIQTDGGGSNPDVMDNNIYYSPTWSGTQKYVAVIPNYIFFAALPSYGFETNGYFINPLLVDSTNNSPLLRDFHPTTNSPAMGKGRNLSAFFTTDAAGTPRPTTGGWTIGAFEPASAETPTPPPPPPPPAVEGHTFPAGEANLTAPFALADGAIGQTVQTVDPVLGGRAAFAFTITYPGNYVVRGQVAAPSASANSLFINMDAEPSSPTMIWDIPVTSGYETRLAGWRGNGSDVSNEFTPKVFTLSAGAHQLVIRGREANVRIQSLIISQLPPAPGDVEVIPLP